MHKISFCWERAIGGFFYYNERLIGIIHDNFYLKNTGIIGKISKLRIF
ncbi:hypothetical protein DJ66_0098 [Candidatus Liberibacter solanacearum]|uniref:Uncharacterized protein n=1 Tax=Candidatus Liberibacter solanacearum TaxID=556287 RepID=A0A0F4VLY3_9HYPH|nr:hypothetical protein DJ66_0098 [Candidatus Liberibacter solanacearum]